MGAYPATAILACFLLVGVAQAQSPGPAAPPAISDEARAAALDLAEATGGTNTAATMMGLLRNQMVASMQRSSAKPADEVARVVDEVLLPEMKGRVGELTAMTAAINASNYTATEMRELAAFYRTPLGRRVVEVAPKIGAESFTAGQAWGVRVAQDAIRKNAAELRRRGITL